MGTWPEALHIIVPPHTEGFGLGAPQPPDAYLGRLADHLAAAEAVGATGAFVYDFPGALDPWLAAFDVLACSTVLMPIVAVRPHQTTPEAVARRTVDLAYRFGRPTHLNVVAGATSSSRTGTDDPIAERRHLADFVHAFHAEVRPRLAAGAAPPLVYTPASATPGVVPAEGTLLLAKPRDDLAAEIARVVDSGNCGHIVMLVGFVARPTAGEAWAAAREIHGPDRRQQIAGSLFAAQVVSSQHRASYALADEAELHDELLWFGAPMRGIDAPKLVGSYDEIRAALAHYRRLGVTEIIVDLPAAAAEYEHVGHVFAGGIP